MIRRPISSRLSARPVAVVGAGTMGADIALCFGMAGIQTRLWARRAGGLADAMDRVRRRVEWLEARGQVTNARHIEDLITPAIHLEEAVNGAGFVIEATHEDFATKREVFGQIEALIDPAVVLASTTSSLSAADLAQELKQPERFVITHFAQPAHLVEVVEVVAGPESSESVVTLAEDLLRDAAKVPIRVGDVAGFLFARLQYALLRELVDLVDSGVVTAADCDLLVRRGYAPRLPAMGPFTHADLIGLDFANTLANRIWPTLSNRGSTMDTSLHEHVAIGDLGAKTGQGYFRWDGPALDRVLEARDEAVIRANAAVKSE